MPTGKGRLKKATQFIEAADLIDAFVTLCVHAGIAAADVICCARLGVHAQGKNHGDAVIMLAKVDKKLAQDLATLVGMKTKSGYSPLSSSRPTKKAAARSAGRLVAAAVAG